MVAATLALGLGAWPNSARGQSLNDLLVMKGQVFSQTTEATVTPYAGGGGVFAAQAPGLTGPPVATSASVTVPDGTSRAMTFSASADLFLFTVNFETVAALDAAYPAGNYKVSVTLEYPVPFAAMDALPSDYFPAPPLVGNYAGAQAVTPSEAFTLAFQAFADAGASDLAAFVVYQGGIAILSNSLATTDTACQIPANTLAANTTYEGRLRFLHLHESAPVSGAIPAYGFFSETRFPIVTGGGTGPTNSPPPALTSATPPNGTIMGSSLEPLVLQFDRPMNPADIAIQWSVSQNGAPLAIDPSKFVYLWSSVTNLVCDYDLYGAGWPAGCYVAWTLNPTPGAPGNFTGVNGTPLATNNYAGNFYTAGGPWACLAEMSNVVATAPFYLRKVVNYVQSNDNAPAPDAALGAQFLAQLVRSFAPGAAAPEVLLTLPFTPPGGNPLGTNFLNLPSTSLLASSGLEMVYSLSNTYASGPALDAAYPAGNYSFELAFFDQTAQPPAFVVTNAVALAVTNNAYPPIPQFTNATAFPVSAMTNGFAVDWGAYAGADPLRSYAVLQIVNATGAVVLRAPDDCKGVKLSPGDTSLNIPPGLLAPEGGPYSLALTFGRLSDPAEALPGAPGFGYSSLERTTRMLVGDYLASHPLPPPPVVSLADPSDRGYVRAGAVTFQVAAAQTNGWLTQLQLFSGSNLLTTLPLPQGTTSFTGPITATLLPGPQNIQVAAFDSNGQSATSATLGLIAESASFVVDLMSPADRAVFPPFAAVGLSATASSPSGVITRLDFFMDGAPLGTVATAPYRFVAPQVSPDAHSFYARATDNGGYSALSRLVAISVSPPPPNHLAAFVSTNGVLSAGFGGVAAGAYVLEATASLTPPVVWTPIQTKLLSGATALFSDATYGRFPGRYYRVSPANASATNPPAFSVWDRPNPRLSSTDQSDWLEGASASLTNTDGTLYSLSIPPSAIDAPEPVALTVVDSIPDYPLTGAMVAAVNVGPSDYYLFAQGLLTIQLPPALSPAAVVAFTYHQPNGEFFLTPFQMTNVVTGSATNPAVAIPLDRLGGYGLAVLNTNDLALLSRFTPSDPADALDQTTAFAQLKQRGIINFPKMRRARGNSAGGGGSGPQPDDKTLVQSFLDQFAVIYPQMQAAVAAGNLDCNNHGAWTRWFQDLYAAGLQDSFSIQVAEWSQAWNGIVENFVYNAIKNANQQHDWNDIIRLSKIDTSGSLYRRVTSAYWAPGQVEALQQAIDACLTFELDFESVITDVGGDINEASDLKATVTFSQGNTSTLALAKGQATPVWASIGMDPVSKCGAVTSSPTTPPFVVYYINPQGSRNQGTCSGNYTVWGLSCGIWPNRPLENYQTVCQGYPTPLGDYWWAGFGYFHESDLTTFPRHPGASHAAPQAVFKLEDDWQISGGGGNPTLATLQVNQSQTLTSSVSGTITETTTITLKHTPQ